jgi:hypothetical protein
MNAKIIFFLFIACAVSIVLIIVFELLLINVQVSQKYEEIDLSEQTKNLMDWIEFLKFSTVTCVLLSLSLVIIKLSKR